ncbi:unnamed protein product, partial [Ranitomeya imitator]
SPYRTVLRENAIPTIFDLTSHLGNPGRRRKRIKELSEEEIRILKERKRTEVVFGLQHSFLMASKSFLDIELLIALVRRHPELYDPWHDSYSELARRGTVWNQISSEIFMDWDSLNPQQRSMKVREVQTQWHSLKENFRQELHRQMGQELPPPGAEVPACPHFKELMFLQPIMVVDKKAVQRPAARRTGERTDDDPVQVVPIKEEPPSPPDFIKTESEAAGPHYTIHPQHFQEDLEEEDPHMDFARCLVPYLARVPDSQQASLRMALTNLIFCYIERSQGGVPTVSPRLMRYISAQDEPPP